MLRARWMHSHLRGTPLVRELWQRQFDAGYAYCYCQWRGLVKWSTWRARWINYCTPYRQGYNTAVIIQWQADQREALQD